MSFELLANGRPLGECGTNAGFYHMARLCERRGGKECKAFFTDGECDNPQVLKRELSEILRSNPKPPDDVVKTIKRLVALLDGAKGKVAATCE